MFKIGISKIKLNRKGFRQLRTSAAVNADIGRRAKAIAAAAGPGWVAQESPGVNRARWVVIPTTDDARRESITEMAPLRAMDAGRS